MQNFFLFLSRINFFCKKEAFVFWQKIPSFHFVRALFLGSKSFAFSDLVKILFSGRIESFFSQKEKNCLEKKFSSLGFSQTNKNNPWERNIYKTLIVLCFFSAFFSLGGCKKSLPSQNRPLAFSFIQKSLAKNAFAGIYAKYPPALSIFALTQTPKDLFGKELVSLLQTNGYGIITLSSAKKEDFFSPPILLSWKYGEIDPASPFLFLSLKINQTLYTRAFFRKGTDIFPSGPWMQEER